MKKLLFSIAFLIPLATFCQVDLSVDSVFHRSGVGGYFEKGLTYYKTSEDYDPTPVHFSTLVSNQGISNATNVYCRLEIYEDGLLSDSVYSDTVNILAGASDSLVFVYEYLTGLSVQTAYVVSINSDSADSFVSNNLDSISLIRQGEFTEVVARDNDQFLGSISPGEYLNDIGELLVAFEFQQDADIYGTEFHLNDDTSQLGALGYISLYKLDSNENLLYVTQTDDFSVWQANLGDWNHRCFYDYIPVDSGEVYFLGLGDYQSGVKISTAQKFEDSTVFFKLYTDTILTPLDNAVGMLKLRLDVDYSICYSSLPDLGSNLDFGVFPNPSSSSTTLSYQLQHPSQSKINITNLQGKILQSIDLGYQTEGKQEVLLNLEGLSNGVYLINLLVGDNAQTERLIISK